MDRTAALTKEARVAFAAYSGLGRDLIDRMIATIEANEVEIDRLAAQVRMLREALDRSQNGLGKLRHDLQGRIEDTRLAMIEGIYLDIRETVTATEPQPQTDEERTTAALDEMDREFPFP